MPDPAGDAVAVLVLIAAAFELPASLEHDWLALLPDDRRARIAARPAGGARQRSLLGTRLLAEGLVRLGHPAAALGSLREAPGGRLLLALPLEVSVSHADDLVVCALSTDGPVGVDVEALGAQHADAFRVYLSEAERAAAGASPQRFYSIWTRKEAVVKAAATHGLAALPEVDTTIGPEHAVFRGALWWTPPLELGRGHVGHLALADRPTTVTLSRVNRAALERLPT